VLSAMLMRLTNEIILTLFDFLKNASSHDSDYIRQILASVYVTVMSSCDLSKRPKVNTVYGISGSHGSECEDEACCDIASCNIVVDRVGR
jgi:hypothetical protein